MKKTWIGIAIFFTLSFTMGSGHAEATELAFKFNNPSFGGNPFVGQQLMANATAQNEHKPNAPEGLEELDEGEEFEQNLRRQVLNRLARRVIDSAFGSEEGALTPGTHVIGESEIVVSDDGITITVVITDIGTGNSTTVSVPRF